MILKIITMVFIITNLMRSSIANNSLKQKSLQMSKDCPRQKYCRKGAHVVCMYYDPDQVFGHHCLKPVRVEVTPNMIHHILANVNFLRSKLAMGKETLNNDVLPRAYGLMKLEWDKELAFSAQVLANQCLGDRKDECRASEKFRNPGQSISIIQYKYPNWEYLTSSDSERGLDEMKLIFAMDIFLRSSHKSKINMTKDIFTNYPSLDELVDINQKHYLNLIYGGVTHIGCGVSAYAKKMNADIEKIKNIVQIVCNFSDAPKRNQPVYNMVPPIPGDGHSKRCGCPRDYKETHNCLCERESKDLRRAIQLNNELQTGVKQDSKRNIKHRTSHSEEMIASEKKDRQINNQLTRHIISKSRNLIVFRRNPEGDLVDDTTVVNVESTNFSEITNAPMITRTTRKEIEEKERIRSKESSSRTKHSSSHHSGGSSKNKKPGHKYGSIYGSDSFSGGKKKKLKRKSFFSKIVAKIKKLLKKFNCG